MKVLILSDSHGWTKEVSEIIQRHEEEVDAVFHCGDSELSTSSPVLEDVRTVKGNCDFVADFPEDIVEDIDGIRFFVTHGHLLNVKMTDANLFYKGKEAGADIICFGHTHIPRAMKEDGMIFINPGSIRQPKKYPVGTYVILELENNEVKVSYYSVDGKEEKKLKNIFINYIDIKKKKRYIN